MAKDKNIEEGMGSSNDREASSASSANGESSNRNNRGKRRVREDDIEEPIAPKKAKIVWTNPLHNRFLLALHHLGLDKAVPKKILEFMNVPGLTRENVASHLQKYRMFLKKVAEKGLWQSQAMSDKLLRSSFATGYNPHRNALSFPSAPGYGGLSRFPNFTHEASSSTAPPPFRHGQSSLLAGHRPNPMLGNFGQQNPARFGVPSNGFPTTPLSMFQPNQTVGSNFSNPNYSSLSSGNGSGGGLFPPYNSGSGYAGIRLNGNQLGAGQMGASFGADLAANPNFGYGFGDQNPNPNLAGSSSGFNSGAGNSFTGNGMSGFVPNNAGFGSSSAAFGDFLGQGGPSSSSMFGSRANNPITMGFNGSNDQGLAAIFNGTPNRRANAENSGGSEFPFSLLNDVSGPWSSSNSQHVELDDHDLDLFFGSTQFQQQNGGNAMDFEINTNDFLNAEFSNSCSLVDKAPWTQQSSPESVEGTGNANTGSSSNSMDSFFLQSAEGTGNANTGSSSNSIDSFFHQSQSSPEEAMPSDLNLTGQSASPPSDENQSFGDDLLDMLLSNHPF